MLHSATARVPFEVFENYEFDSPSLHDCKQKNKLLPILLVEDYEPHVVIASIIFNNFGYECVVAHNGADAVALFVPGKYSMVLMDVGMPVMDGYKATRQIREREQFSGHKPITIIAMTTHSLKGDREKCLGVGMDDYIAKPFNFIQFEKTLNKYMRKA